MQTWLLLQRSRAFAQLTKSLCGTSLGGNSFEILKRPSLEDEEQREEKSQKSFLFQGTFLLSRKKQFLEQATVF